MPKTDETTTPPLEAPAGQPTGQPTDAPQAVDPAEGPTEAPEAPETASREAARYRRQLRETEAARDALAARVQAFQTLEASRLATGPGRLLDADDLWRVTDLPGLLGDDGEVDPQKVAVAVAGLLDAKPHYAAPPVVGVDLDLGGRSGPPPAGATWGDLLAGKK